MHVHFIEEENIIFSYSTYQRDKKEFFQKSNTEVPISHVGEEAQKILCESSTVRVMTLTRYRAADPISAKDFEEFVRMLNPKLFLDREWLREILRQHSPRYETILVSDGHWNLIPMVSEGHSVVVGVTYIGDGWRFSHRRIRHDSDTRGEDIAPRDYLILKNPYNS